MSNTNYFSGIVKILESPKQQVIKSKTLITTCRVEIPQKRKNKIVRLIFWGNLANDVNKFYKLNDYILIEGYISLRDRKSVKSLLRKSKQVTITVLRIFPILLNSDRIL